MYSGKKLSKFLFKIELISSLTDLMKLSGDFLIKNFIINSFQISSVLPTMLLLLCFIKNIKKLIKI